MKTALDSNIISALFSLEPSSTALVTLLGKLRQGGAVVICGVVYAEIHAIPGITPQILTEFLLDTGIRVETEISLEHWNRTGQAFAEYAQRRRKNGDAQAKRLLADFMIGTHAQLKCDQLLTLDPKRYTQGFPDLKILSL